MAVPAHAEVIPDADTTGGEDPGPIDDRTGLTAEETALFDSMREDGGTAPVVDRGAPAPGGDGLDDEDEEIDGLDHVAPEPPADGAPAPAAKDAPPAKAPPKTVSYQKYMRERTKWQRDRTEAQQVAERERADRIKLGERLAILNEALTAASPPDPATQMPANPLEEEDIDPNVDMWKAFDQERRRTKFLQEQLSGVHQQTEESRADQQLRENYERDVINFMSQPQTRDFQQAYNHLKDSRLVEIGLTETGKDPSDPNAQFTEEEVNRIVSVFNDEERWLVTTTLQQRRSPAQAIYSLAKSRGYKTPAAAAASPPPPPAPGARVPATRPAAPAPAPVVAELEALRRNRDAGKSLSDAGSTDDVTALTPERLIAMSPEEFAAMIDTIPKRQLDAMMGKE